VRKTKPWRTVYCGSQGAAGAGADEGGAEAEGAAGAAEGAKEGEGALAPRLGPAAAALLRGAVAAARDEAGLLGLPGGGGGGEGCVELELGRLAMCGFGPFRDPTVRGRGNERDFVERSGISISISISISWKGAGSPKGAKHVRAGGQRGEGPSPHVPPNAHPYTRASTLYTFRLPRPTAAASLWSRQTLAPRDIHRSTTSRAAACAW
jgi:hypothetical protein